MGGDDFEFADGVGVCAANAEQGSVEEEGDGVFVCEFDGGGGDEDDVDLADFCFCDVGVKVCDAVIRCVGLRVEVVDGGRRGGGDCGFCVCVGGGGLWVC